jgi:hypothetical protein
VNEPLDLPKTEEPLPELTAELLSMETPAPEAAWNGPGQPVVVVASWLRLAYAVEFLVALIAILDMWSEIGGQGHLDLMPWHIKLACIAGLAWCCVRFTAGIVEQSKVWTRRTVAWFSGILLFGIAMGGITYYYHLHEEPEDDDEDTTATSIRIPTPGVFLYDASKGKKQDAHDGQYR